MVALFVTFTALCLLAILPLGIHIAFQDETYFLKLKLGILKIQIFPRKRRLGRKKHCRKKKKLQETPQHAQMQEEGKEKRRWPSFSDFIDLAKIVLCTALKFRRNVSVDCLRFVLCVGGDPYDAILSYGRCNAALSTLTPLLHRTLKIREEELRVELDFFAVKNHIDAEIIVSLQFWELVYIGFSSGYSLLRWYMTFRKRIRTDCRKKCQLPGKRM